MSELLKMSLSPAGITLNQIDLDINNLFSLSYTFDNLKLFMKTLLENQNIMSSKLNELEKSLNEQKEKSKKELTTLEKKIKTISIKKDITQTKKIIIEKETFIKNKERKSLKDNKNNKNDDNKNNDNNKNDDKNDNNNIIINNVDENKKKKETIIENKKKKEDFNLEPISESIAGDDDFDNEQDFLVGNEEIDNIKEKLDTVEQRLNTIEKNSKFNPSNLLNQENSNEDIQLMKLNMKSLEDKYIDLNKEKDEMKKDLEEIKVKVVDFNIYELFKDCQTSEGTLDASKLLIMNLEEKFIKKTSIMDEKIKKSEEDMYNIKNEFQNVKNISSAISNSLNGFKNNIKEISDQFNKTNDENSNVVNETKSKINETYKKSLQKIEDEKKNTKKMVEKLKNQIKKIYDNMPVENEKQNEVKDLSDNDLRCLAELTKRISDLEKQMKMIYHSFDVSKTKEDIAKIENELNQKTNEKDFYDLSDKVNLQSTVINNIKETLERVQEIGNKNSKDLNFFLRKLESVTASIIAFKASLEALSGVKNESIFDPTRYLDVASFNEFIKAHKKDIEKVDRTIDDVRRLITDMAEIIKTKASGEDMKTFENLMNNKLGEMKLLWTRKFADKVDTNKNFKYVDTQIKHITQIVMKKNDKNESWLLAKKPVGGYSCASCEAYLGELREKADFLAWNKYPNREKEKNYRIGNGFSHMLNMLNVDVKTQDFNCESDDEMHRTAMVGSGGSHIKNLSKINMMNTAGLNGFNRSNILPKIIGKNEDYSNLSAENLDRNNEQNMQGNNTGLYSNEENNISINSNQPHIVKIFRKNKLSAPDITRMDK